MSWAWSRSLSHSLIGKSGGHDANPARKWFLKVRIARSAALRRWMYGGANSKSNLLFIIALFKSSEHSLSNMYCLT